MNKNRSYESDKLSGFGIREKFLIEFQYHVILTVFFVVLERGMKTYMCLICGWIYNEESGSPDEGIAPGTRWEDVPITWTCPECGAQKTDFDMVEI